MSNLWRAAVVAGALLTVPAAGFPSIATHATKGIVTSVNPTTLVITRSGQQMTFALDGSTQRDGEVTVGSTVEVRYRTEANERVATAISVRPAASGSAIDDIRRELLQLPYYGVFDFLSFKYDRGTVTLMGYAYRPTLKSDATRALKRVSGVDAVNDQIEALPVSMHDDELRWQTYYAIYRDPFLSRYTPGGGMLWGHRHPFGRGALLPLGPSRFPGTEPAGDYPIHIIVKQGRITLLGVVDSEGDKTAAGMRARGVPGSFGIDNDLMVDRPAPTGTSDSVDRAER